MFDAPKEGEIPACVSSTATGAIVAMVPIDVPIAVEMKAATKNNPMSKNCVGINERAKITPPTMLQKT